MRYRGSAASNLKLDQALADTAAYISNIEKFDTNLNKEIAVQFKSSVLPTLTVIQTGLKRSKGEIQVALQKANEIAGDWDKLHKEQESQFTQLKQKFEKNREFFQKLNQLTKRVTAKTVSQKELTTVSEKLDSAVDQREKPFLKLSKTSIEKYSISGTRKLKKLIES